MFEKHTKDAEEREQALETRLSAKYAADLDQVREKFAAEIEGVKETIKIADDKLESLKARFGEMEERFNDRRDGEKIGETAPDNEKLARANRELIGILRRDLDEFREEWETLRGTQQRADRARDEKIQNVSDEIEVVKSNQSNTKRLQKKLQNLEWRVMENVAVPTEVNDKGKGKRKRKEKEKNKETEQETVTNARMPATANEAMADVDGVL